MKNKTRDEIADILFTSGSELEISRLRRLCKILQSMELVSLFGFDITGSNLSDVTFFSVTKMLVVDVGDEFKDVSDGFGHFSPIF